jgi:hypothetical protein
MNASLDTCIVIHLYKSDKRELLYSPFEKLYIYEFLLETELKNKDYDVYKKFLLDIEEGKVQVITNKDLINNGIKGLFENYIEQYNYLFDQGELYAVALAKAMGIATFASDDTKDKGPHETLVKEIIEDVIPFAFYELLFLKFLASEITIDEMYSDFEQVNLKSMRERPMNFKNRMLSTARRFTKKYGTERDLKWIDDYCLERKIDLKNKMKELK